MERSYLLNWGEEVGEKNSFFRPSTGGSVYVQFKFYSNKNIWIVFTVGTRSVYLNINNWSDMEGET